MGYKFSGEMAKISKKNVFQRFDLTLLTYELVPKDRAQKINLLGTKW